MGLIGAAAGMAVREGLRSAARPQPPAARLAELRAEVAQTAASRAEVMKAAATVGIRQHATLVQQREVLNGDQVLRYNYTALKHFAVWNCDAEIVTAALWVAMTHGRDSRGFPVFPYCSRLGIFGPSGSGKSWKSRLVGKLSYKGEILVEMTKPSFIDFVADHNTVIITEADEAFRSPGRSRGILAVINASYEPDRATSRKQGGQKVKIPLFAPIVLDGVDTLLSEARQDLRTMISRCIIIRAQQAPDGYRPPRFNTQARAVAEMICNQNSAWMAQEVAGGIGDDEPDVPDHLGNRPFALWEPLFAIAARADQFTAKEREERGETGPGPWTAACWNACEQLESAPEAQAAQTVEKMSELDRSMAQWGYDGPAGELEGPEIA